METSIIATEVFEKLPIRYMAGKSLPQQVRVTAEVVSPGLAKRLHAYAVERLRQAGMEKAVEGFEVVVSTSDAEDRPSERQYEVSWINKQRAFIAVVGILTSRGWPSLDHGLSIGEHA
ncbi:hypothetical protein [Pseudomonas sp. NPDC096950]|uniref:hypothetical protein n=1 Tax=Pseudomonas sp. NPDC096950 TaxID=3364485 RepID=UPI00383A6719